MSTMIKHVLVMICITSLLACSKDGSSDDGGVGSLPEMPTSTQSLIPLSQIRDGGPGKDGIPSVDNPQFIDPGAVTFLEDNDRVMAVQVNGEVKVYPHPIMDWHEIVNDEVGGQPLALTYCPLTGTGIAWDRNTDKGTTTFGVSGKLYNNNLIPYDRETDSYWSQINLNCFLGERLGEEILTFPSVETSWKTIWSMFPNAKVLSTNTGFSRNYGLYPYGDYRTNNAYIIFPLEAEDNRLPAKERVLGVFHKGASKTYRINSFDTPALIRDQIGGETVTIIGSKAHDFLVAFLEEAPHDLSVDLRSFPIIARNSRGNAINIFGDFVEGPDSGNSLTVPVSFMGYWFSFGAFHTGIDIYEP